MQQLGSDDRGKQWRHGDDESAQAYTDDGERRGALLGAYPIDQPAARHLAQKADDAADGEDEPDIDLRPLLGGQIDRKEWPEAGLDVGNEEGEPVEAALTGARGRFQCMRLGLRIAQIALPWRRLRFELTRKAPWPSPNI